MKHRHTNTKNKISKNYFLVLSVLPMLEKHIRLGHNGIVDPSVNLSISDLKGMDRSNKVV